MPRNGSGSYSLPQSAFVAGTTISSASMNSDLSDIAAALTASLPRDGQAGMTGQLKIPDGSIPAPALAFSNEPNTGFTRPSAGLVALSILGTQTFTFAATGATGNFQGSVPAGTIVDFASDVTPTGWLACAGQAVSRTTFVALFVAIGTYYGAGDGTTTFNIPDCRDYVLVGRGNMGGIDAGRLTTAFYGGNPTITNSPGGSQSKALVTANIAAHTHSGNTGNDAPDHTHQVTTVGSTGVSATPTGPGFSVNAVTITTAGANSRHTHPFTTDNGTGSGTAFATVQPSLIMNKIIYTGG